MARRRPTGASAGDAEEMAWIMDPDLNETTTSALVLGNEPANKLPLSPPSFATMQNTMSQPQPQPQPTNSTLRTDVAKLPAGRKPSQRRNERDVNAVGGATNIFESTSFDEESHFLEKQFLLACERGDMGSVRKLIALAQRTPSMFNLNCVDPLGRSALLIAVENENIEMIEGLLDTNVETGDAILYAINEENVEAVEIMLNHLEKIDKFTAETQGVEINEHSAFTPDITPLILGAHRDNYEIIKLLLDRGAAIPHPHDVRCACEDCLQATAEDSLRLSRSRIHAYRALASPSLICLSQTRDPVLYTFELSWELRRLSYIENEFRVEYQELSQRCQKFGVDLLDQVRGSKELEIILNHDNSDKIPTAAAANDVPTHERMQLSRLKLAIQYRQKRFVAHPNCQQLLASIWYEGLPGFRRRNIIFKILLILLVSSSFPLLSLLYLVAPKSTLSKFVRQPFVKFLCHSASYVFFLLLLILASQRIEYGAIFSSPSNGTGVDESSVYRKERRGPPATPIEWAILAYVLGLIWVEIKQLNDVGLRTYAHDLWNILDFITNALYLSMFSLRLVAYILVKCEDNNSKTKHLSSVMKRKDWDAWDPTLISECIFATANIFSALKLVHIFTVNPHLGPLQISLGRMVIDIMKFFILYCLVLFAFACGLNQLFWYYATMRRSDCERFRHGDMDGLSQEIRSQLEESCERRFYACASLFQTLETLFWALFGLIDLDHFQLREAHYITEWAGKTMFGCYGYISIIVLLNMLIAMMSNSYQYISNQADVEWKFARSKLWIEYFEEGATLPVPFNIIPSPKSSWYLFRALLDRYCGKCLRQIHQTKQRSLRLQKILKAVSQREQNYQRTLDVAAAREMELQFVVRNLVKRYIAHVQRVKQQALGVSEDDVNEIKQDISAFRYELLAILRSAGYDTGHSDISQKTSSASAATSCGGDADEPRKTRHQFHDSPKHKARNKKRCAQAERRLLKGFNLDVSNLPVPEAFLPKAPGDKAQQQPFSALRRPSKTALLGGPSLGSSAWTRVKKLSKKIQLQAAASGGANRQLLQPQTHHQHQNRTASYRRRLMQQRLQEKMASGCEPAAQKKIADDTKNNNSEDENKLWETTSSENEDETAAATRTLPIVTIEPSADDTML